MKRPTEPKIIQRLPLPKVRLQPIGLARQPIKRLMDNPDAKQRYQIAKPAGFLPSLRMQGGFVFASLWKDGSQHIVGSLRVEWDHLAIEFNKDARGQLAERFHIAGRLKYVHSSIIQGSIVATLKS